MKIVNKITVFAFLYIISLSTHASPEVCRSELRELIIPPLDHVAMNKKDIQADIEDVSDGVYSVRLYVAADSPDNLDKQVSIGWVNLDTNSMKALDVTKDPEHPQELKVNDAKYRNFISDCLHKPSKAASQCEELNHRASQTAIRIPHSESEMTVIGNGRLQFYSAPDLSCKMSGVFILTGESVVADKSDHGFTSVAYQPSQKTDPVRGWVRSDRLNRTSLGTAPHQPANGEQIK
ncbi:hypothetical protein [Burkholderia glumae]|uniref:Lipoprotein n=2 Tax=Burkholderia glumae TaxID=337 RepID=A0ABY5BEX8_BURGL|nr:hypothetical protein [Burkholderia glumae]MCM2547241.1 hypothetical protein [Burkholderia glumae]MCQ0034638.1 hypothetical protein [Burkholderia glumae]MCQ0040420.1 hypothetical protein [Burkholderia glumae]USS44151.1 hypothetical protein NFI99_12750 [Burkholderia glumae]